MYKCTREQQRMKRYNLLQEIFSGLLNKMVVLINLFSVQRHVNTDILSTTLIVIIGPADDNHFEDPRVGF